GAKARVGVTDGGGRIAGRSLDAPALSEGLPAPGAPGVDDADLVPATLALQRVRVEVADEASPQHRDGVAVHRSSLSLRPSTRSRPATRARSFARVAARGVWLKPQSGTRVRPAAGTPAGNTASMRSATSCAVSRYEFLTSMTPAPTCRPAAAISPRIATSAISRLANSRTNSSTRKPSIASRTGR